MRVAVPQEVKIRRRIHLAQRAVQIEGVNLRNKIQPLRRYNLKNIARRDVFLAAVNHAHVLKAARPSVNLQLSRLPFCRLAPQCRTQAPSQFPLQPRDVSQCPVVRSPWFFPRNVSGRDNVNLMTQVIKRQQAIKEHQFRIGQMQVICCVLADVFQLPHHVVGKVAFQPLVGHGVAAVLHDDRLAVEALDVRQRLGEDPCLLGGLGVVIERRVHLVAFYKQKGERPARKLSGARLSCC